MAAREFIVWAKTWPEVLELLTEKYGENAKVAIVPDATMQYFTRYNEAL
jgi:hypothetical protein